MGSRIAFVVNALTGPELSGGKSDSARVYAVLTNSDLGKCDARRSPSPLHECASKRAFGEALDKVLAGLGTDDQFVFYFTGHGTYRGEQYCLVFGHQAPDYLPFDNIMRDLRIHYVNRALIILDACHSGAAVESGRKADGEVFKPLNLPTGIAILTSCRGLEFSSELPDGSSSVFTLLLCEAIETGLNGKATKGGFISVSDAVDFINDRIKNDTRFTKYRQTPRHGIYNAGGSIWIARNKSGDANIVPIPREIGSIEELKLAYDSTAHSRRPCSGATAADLNWELVHGFAEKTDRRFPSSSSSDEIAKALGLFSAIPWSGARFLHNAAVLCFCDAPERYFPQARSTFVVGDQADDLTNLKHVTGNLRDQIQTLVSLTMRELRMHASFGDGAQRQEISEIPINVVREVISNAITHRSYRATGTVLVRLTSDFLEVVSPGSFPTGYSWEHFLTQPVSCPNDEAIAYYLTHQLSFEGIGRGFAVFRQFIEEHGPDALVCELRAGPSVAVRIARSKGSGNLDLPFESRYLAQLREGRIGYQELSGESYFVHRTLECHDVDEKRLIATPDEFFRRIHRCVILGKAGSGKSTLLKFLCRELATGRGSRQQYVPIFTGLRSYNATQPFLNFIAEQIYSVSLEAPPNGYVDRLLESGRAVLALDGLDEIALNSTRTNVFNTLGALSARYPEVRIVLTSRDTGYVRFGQADNPFPEVWLVPLSEADVQKFVTRRLGAHADPFLTNTVNLRELRSNPLLLSLMCSVFENSRQVPSSSLRLVEECCGEILSRWDTEKSIAPDNLSDHWHILPYLANEMVRSRREAISGDELAQIALLALQSVAGHDLVRSTKIADAFIRHYSDRSGIIFQVWKNQFSFLHRIFLEYFAALFIANSVSDHRELAKFVAMRMVTDEEDAIALYVCELWARQAGSPHREFCVAVYLATLKTVDEAKSNRILARVSSAVGEPEAAADLTYIGVAYSDWNESLSSDLTTKEQYAQYYGSGAYDRRYPRANHSTLEAILGAIHSTTAPTNKILDFGCGSGRYTIPLASHCKTIVAYDPCPEAIYLLKKRSQRNITPSQDLHHVLQAGPYNVVVCIFSVLSHIPERRARLDTLRFLRRCLATDGLLFVSVPNRLRRFYKEQLDSAFKRGDFSGRIEYRRSCIAQLMPCYLYTPASLRRELEECKFSVESIKAESLLPEMSVTNSDHVLEFEKKVLKKIPPWLGYGLLAIARKG
jgi:SAM-dependent methyltransferase